MASSSFEVCSSFLEVVEKARRPQTVQPVAMLAAALVASHEDLGAELWQIFEEGLGKARDGANREALIMVLENVFEDETSRVTSFAELCIQRLDSLLQMLQPRFNIALGQRFRVMLQTANRHSLLADAPYEQFDAQVAQLCQGTASQAPAPAAAPAAAAGAGAGAGAGARSGEVSAKRLVREIELYQLETKRRRWQDSLRPEGEDALGMFTHVWREAQAAHMRQNDGVRQSMPSRLPWASMVIIWDLEVLINLSSATPALRSTQAAMTSKYLGRHAPQLAALPRIVYQAQGDLAQAMIATLDKPHGLLQEPRDWAYWNRLYRELDESVGGANKRMLDLLRWTRMAPQLVNAVVCDCSLPEALSCLSLFRLQDHIHIEDVFCTGTVGLPWTLHAIRALGQRPALPAVMVGASESVKAACDQISLSYIDLASNGEPAVRGWVHAQNRIRPFVQIPLRAAPGSLETTPTPRCIYFISLNGASRCNQFHSG